MSGMIQYIISEIDDNKALWETARMIETQNEIFDRIAAMPKEPRTYREKWENPIHDPGCKNDPRNCRHCRK